MITYYYSDFYLAWASTKAMKTKSFADFVFDHIQKRYVASNVVELKFI